ncbi:hypothetical protein NX059_001352 [Plenodomus lindquistii]|nr:hypothetical protein NX059_001352 [Plenodomus lindquistii]
MVKELLKDTEYVGGGPAKSLGEWGQVVNVLGCAYASCHVLYSYWRLFRREVVYECASNTKTLHHLKGQGDEQGERPTPFRGVRFLDAPWKWFRERQPFTQRHLDPMDLALVLSTSLHTITSTNLEPDPHQQKQLLDTVVEGFRYGRRKIIKKALFDGAPKDERGERGNYLIHLAAILGDEKF